mmetsp:Transcript_6063/g.15526  ORF Transcript_6063/g.15526 Transcript_6063/m.15526 type:complete len:286 (+) Transcript_6063:464-1321(+)
MLCTYHTYLICVNETTNENVKDLYYEGNPFDEGVMHNCAHMCCRLAAPPIEYVDEDDLEARMEMADRKWSSLHRPRDAPMQPVDEGGRGVRPGEIELSDVAPLRNEHASCSPSAADDDGDGAGAPHARRAGTPRVGFTSGTLGRRATPQELAEGEEGEEPAAGDDGRALGSCAQPSTSQLSSEADEQDQELAVSKPLLVTQQRAPGGGEGANEAGHAQRSRARVEVEASDGAAARVADEHDADDDNSDSEASNDDAFGNGSRRAARSPRRALARRKGERYKELAS